MQSKKLFSAGLIAIFVGGSVGAGMARADDDDWKWRHWNRKDFKEYRKDLKEHRKDVRKFWRQQQRAWDRLDNRWFDNRWQPRRWESRNYGWWWW